MQFKIPAIDNPYRIGRGCTNFLVAHSSGHYFGAYLPDVGTDCEFGVLLSSGKNHIAKGMPGWRFLAQVQCDGVPYPFYHGDYLDLKTRKVFVNVVQGVMVTDGGSRLPIAKNYLMNFDVGCVLGNHWEGAPSIPNN